MSCNQYPILGTIPITDGDCTAGSWTSWSALDSRWLIVSDCPENVPAFTGTENLYKVDIPIHTASTSFRFFLWHINTGTVPIYIEAVIEVNDPATAWSYTDLRREEPATGIVPAGQCIAAALVFGSVGGARSSGTVAAGAVLVVGSFQLSPGDFRGRCYEVTISVPVGKVAYVRTVASTTAGSHGSQASIPIGPEDHVRGSWPQSTQEVQSEFINGVPPDGRPYKFYLGAQGAKDTEKYKARVGDLYARDNKGLYGVTTRYVVNYNANIERYMDILIGTPRSEDPVPPPLFNPVLNYFGAVERVAPAGNHKVPDIRWTEPPRQVVHTGVYVANNLHHLTQTPIPFKSGVGGGAFLPVYLYVKFSPLPFPLEEPL